MAKFFTIRGDSCPVYASFTGRDITGWTFACTVKSAVSQLDADAILKVGPRVATAAEIATAKFQHVFPESETDAIAPGYYLIDMQFDIPAGVLDLLPDGGTLSTPAATFEVVADITRRTT